MQKDNDNIRVAITSDSVSHRNYLRKSMEQSGIEVVLNESLSKNFLFKLEKIESDVLVFDAQAIEDEHLELLDQLFEQTRVPVIINDISGLTLNESVAISKWHHTILRKITEITGRCYWDETISTTVVKKNISESTQISKNEIAKNVWVLGASIGGPDAVKRFLFEIPATLPVTFVLTQHLGDNFVILLAEQLDRYTKFSVKVPRAGHVVRHHEVLVTPTDEQLTINASGRIEYKKINVLSRYTPSINMAITEVALRYKKYAGAIIFSGMCDDGVEGSKIMIQQGGQVWVQNPESCIVSTMSDSVATNIAVTFSGTPELLAKQLISKYTNTH